MPDNKGLMRLIERHVEIARKAVPLMDWIDWGVIQGDGALKVHGFKDAFPIGTYFRLRYLGLPDPMVRTTGAHVGNHGDHAHDVPTPADLQHLRAGDRVLVAWLPGANDPLVLGVAERVVSLA